MLKFLILYFLPPFLFNFLLPGVILTFLFIKKKSVDFLLFIIFAVIFGIAFQMTTGFILGLSSFFFIIPKTTFFLINFIVLTALVYLLFKKRGQLLKISFGLYDITVIFLTIILLLFINYHLLQLKSDYFNPATDQYHWLTLGQRVTFQPNLTTHLLLNDQVHRPAFFLFLTPYTIFLPKNFGIYQQFILTWIYFHYALIAIAIARLTYAILPFKSLSLLSPLFLYGLHWFNYYLLSTGVVPQNTGFFLFIAGLLLLQERVETLPSWLYLIVFYFIHLPTLAIFVFTIGFSKIFEEGVKFFIKNLGGSKYLKTKGDWFIFEKLFLLPALVVLVFYFLYYFNFLEYYNPHLISYYEEYTKDLNLWDQPYLEQQQNLIILLAIIGAGLLIITSAFKFHNELPSSFPLVFSLVTPWLFLRTPLIAYHAFYASWQSFRYLIILYPAIAILSLLPITLIIWLVKNFLSPTIGKISLFLVLITTMPTFLNHAWKQQGNVFLDMIQGRDGGIYNKQKKERIKYLVTLSNKLGSGQKPILLISTPLDAANYVTWAFAPRPILQLWESECSQKSCSVGDSAGFFGYDLNNINPVLAIAKKGDKQLIGMEKILKEKFASREEVDEHVFYY